MESTINVMAVKWSRSIRTKIAVMSAVMLLILAGGYSGHTYMVKMVEEHRRLLQLSAQGALYKFEAQTLGDMIADPHHRADRRKYRVRLREILKENAARTDILVSGDPAQGLRPLQDAEARQLM